MVKNIFITAVGGDIACATLRCIKHGYKYNKIIGCDIHQYVQGRIYIDEFVLAPRFSDAQIYFEFIKSTCINYGVTHFLPMTEDEILIADKNRIFFIENGIKLMINNSNIINIALSKYNTVNFLKYNGFMVPNTYLLDEYDGQESFPLIVKADRGCGSKQVYIVNNNIELKEAIKIIDKPIIQKYVGNPDEEYTMGIFSDGNVTKSIVFKRKLGFGGMSIFVETVMDNQLSIMAERLAHDLELTGAINVQMRKENEAYYIFEINARISSTVGFRYKLGFKDVIWWLNFLDNVKSDLHYEPNPGIIGIKTLDEMIFAIDK